MPDAGTDQRELKRVNHLVRRSHRQFYGQSPVMDNVAPVGIGFPGSSNEGDRDASKSVTSGVCASAVPRLIMKAFYISSSFNPAFSVFMMLIFATVFFRTTSAQGNFTFVGESYDCSSNIICLGKAHVYTGNETGNGITYGRLSLIPEGNYNEVINTAGIAYYNKPVRFLDPTANQSVSFNTSFTLDNTWGVFNNTYIVGDGMAFVISADNSSIGDVGGKLGFFNSLGTTSFKSIVVEFDTYWDPGYPAYDISWNHVSFDFANISWAAAANANASDENVNLADELTVYAWVEYSRDTKQLELRISHRNYRPISPLLNFTVNLFDVVDEYMWVGFSSAAGSSYTNYYIGDWTFESYGILEPTSVPSPTSSPLLISGKSGENKLAVIVGISVGIPAVLLGCLVIALLVRGMSSSTGQGGWTESTIENSLMVFDGMPQRFSYKHLSVATNAFSEASKLGRGGFGSVYRGVLPASGIPVAVKKISGESTQGEREFMAEVSIISQLRHRNLIQLLGWCKDAAKQKYLLVYELMPNGSLEKVLYGPPDIQIPCLSWSQRFNILTGTAAAIDYLHQGWKQQVIHRDIKSSNIMLDEEWNAKLGDFGLARLVDHRREAATTLVAGTYGYIAPEVAASGKFTDKTDIFAFGAVILEVACGRKALDTTQVPEDEMILVDWVWRRLSEGDLLSTVDKRLEEYDSYWMEVVLTVGLLCSHPNPQARPSMRHVVQVLAGDIPVPFIPSSKPDPVFGSDRQSAATDSPRSKTRSTSKSRSGSISLVSTNTSDRTRESTTKSFGTSSNSNS